MINVLFSALMSVTPVDASISTDVVQEQKASVVMQRVGTKRNNVRISAERAGTKRNNVRIKAERAGTKRIKIRL